VPGADDIETVHMTIGRMCEAENVKARVFGDSATAHFLFKLIGTVMESPLRHKIFDPSETLRGAGIRAGQRVLEVGCGTGFFTIPAGRLVGDGGHVYAIDLHPLAIEQVAEKVRDAGLINVTLIKADATEVGLANDSIDLVLLLGVIPSPTLPLSSLLPEMARLLNPDGALAVWTALPWWSPASLAKNGLFTYAGKQAGVHNYAKAE
jgi:demethylmenaquinone methyltransferase/2-methoxy-6-polyprenyl-1,4-benzoquinol methylase